MTLDIIPALGFNARTMSKNKTKFKSLDRYESDPRVREIWAEEENDGPDIWVSLAHGWNWNGCSAVHERTCRAVHGAMLSVKQGEAH